MHYLELWKFLAGLGFFLYGMNLMETLLKNVSGRRFKLFLRNNAKNLFKGILGGALITGIVQSSSVVSLIVLALVEAGIITFRDAMGVIFGTNLGTTLSSWIVATVGFKLDIAEYTMPLIALTSIGMFFLNKRKNIFNLLSVFFALGILFLGLGFMKEGAEVLVKEFDITQYTTYGTFIFVIIGFIITTVIQSSSAAVAITLTGLHAGVLTFPSAAAVVIGAEVGTTIKILIWGVKGSAEKKRVAWGNFIYNIFTSFIAYIFLHWLIYFIIQIVGISDPLIGLVFFQSTINILAIFLFLPFMSVFAKWMETKFKDEESGEFSYISRNLTTMPLLAVDSLRNEVSHLVNKVIQFSARILGGDSHSPKGIIDNLKMFTETSIDITEEYKRLKQTEGDLLEYHALLQEQNLQKEEAELLMHYINASRQAIYAAKAIKDIYHNLYEFNASANDILHERYKSIRGEWNEFIGLTERINGLPGEKQRVDEIQTVIALDKHQEEAKRTEVMNQLKHNKLTEVEASTLMNVNRELRSARKSILNALKIITSGGNMNHMPADETDLHE